MVVSKKRGGYHSRVLVILRLRYRLVITSIQRTGCNPNSSGWLAQPPLSTNVNLGYEWVVTSTHHPHTRNPNRRPQAPPNQQRSVYVYPYDQLSNNIQVKQADVYQCCRTWNNSVLSIYFRHLLNRILDSKGPFHEWFFNCNSNSMEISYCSHRISSGVIAMKFCSLHDRCAVLRCAQFCSDMVHNSGDTLKPIFQWIWMMMEKSLVKRVPGIYNMCPWHNKLPWSKIG